MKTVLPVKVAEPKLNPAMLMVTFAPLSRVKVFAPIPNAPKV